MIHATAVFMLVLATPTVAADNAPAVEAEIKQLELTLAAYLSRGEIDAYAPHLAEDYVRISDDGRVASKSEVLADRRANPGAEAGPQSAVLRGSLVWRVCFRLAQPPLFRALGG